MVKTGLNWAVKTGLVFFMRTIIPYMQRLLNEDCRIESHAWTRAPNLCPSGELQRLLFEQHKTTPLVKVQILAWTTLIYLKESTF